MMQTSSATSFRHSCADVALNLLFLYEVREESQGDIKNEFMLSVGWKRRKQ